MKVLVKRDGGHMGPYSLDQACQMLVEGKLHTWDLCWPDGAREWIALDSIPTIADKAIAIREQRRAEALASAQAVASASPNAPNPQFVDLQPEDPAQVAENRRANRIRITVWSSLAMVLIISAVVWMKYLNNETLIKDLERRTDNLTYAQGENEPFSGTAYGYFIDGTLWEKVDYNDGVREGSRTIWHINGNVALQETYSSSFLQSAASFDFNGAPTDNFADGNGNIMLYWNDTGIRSQSLVYTNHAIVKRTIWDRKGKLLSVIPPELPPDLLITPAVAITPPPPTITNSVLPTNQVFTITNKPTIDTTPDTNMLGRTRIWVIGNLEATSSRVAVDKRIDLIYRNKPTNILIKVFGYPDQASSNWWSYGDMKVRNIQAGGTFKKVHFQIYNGYVHRVVGTP